MKKILLILILCVAFNNLSAQISKVSGIVKDKDGPLPGVSITEKGLPANGTVTNTQGAFTLTLKGKSNTVIVRAVGYATKEVKATSPNLNIDLVPNQTELGEIVVIGYGTQQRKDLTGAVSSVSMKDLSKAPVASFEEALGGRVAGVQVTSQSGQPGDGFQVVIRGNNSVTQDNSPLYVIDGFPIEGYDNSLINPAEIESIDILKDASATAIYGARGANGVVIITTKRGKEGAPSINYQGYLGGMQVSNKIPVLNPYEFVKLQLDINNASATNQYLTRGGKTLDDYKLMNGVDMQDKIFRDALMQSHYLSVRGGTKSTKYSFSGNLFQQDGVIINSGFKRQQLNSSIDQEINKKVKVGLNLAYTTSNTFGTLTAVNGQGASSGRATGSISPTGFLMYNIWGFRPVTGSDADFSEEIIDPEAITDAVLAYNFNPYVQVQNELRERSTENLVSNTYLDWEIIKKLKFKSTFGFNKQRFTNNSFNNSRTSSGNPITSPNAILVNGSVQDNYINNWSNENTISYSNKFKKYHSINALAGVSLQGNKSNAIGFRAIQVPNEQLGLSGLDEGTVTASTANSSLWTLASFLTRVNYSYKSRYLFTANFRADGSSRFNQGNKWSYFPSGSFAWRFSDEKFIKDLEFLNDGKLRMGYGRTGNNRVNDFSYLSVITTSAVSNTYSFNNGAPGTSAIISSVGNENLKWETTDQYNVGLDLSVMNNQLQFTTDVYHKATDNLLINAQIPTISGYFTLLQNVGKVENKGLEFSLSYRTNEKKSFKWNSSFNISFNRNKVLALADNQEAITYTLGNRIAGATPGSISKIGNPLGTFYGYIFEGVYQYNDFDRLADGSYRLKNNIQTNGNIRNNIRPGDIKYKDLNGDLVINAADNTIIGDPNPKHVGGFSNNFSYKNFDLNIFFQWSYGNDIANINRIIFEGGGEFPANLNQYATVANRWTPTNQNSMMPSFRTGSNIYSNAYSSRVIEDGSYLRLKTVFLGYNIPEKYLKKFKIKTFQLYTSAQNLALWTNYTGYDPEVSIVNSALAQGIDFSAYPRNRTITLGLNITL